MTVEPDVYPPDEAAHASAHVKGLAAYQEMYERSVTDPEAFWGAFAEKHFHWETKWNGPVCR